MTFIDNYYKHALNAIQINHLKWTFDEARNLYYLSCIQPCSSCILHDTDGTSNCYLTTILPDIIDNIDLFEHEHIYPKMFSTHPEFFL